MQSNKTALSSLAFVAMPVAILPVVAGFWTAHRHEISAVGTIVVAMLVALLIDRALAKRELSVVADTRVRLLRRLVFVGIFVIGLALGLMQFDSVKRAATGVLASSAVLGLVVGFAARQTLANAIAGILLAITQPIRIGDLVKFEGESGVVEDVRLTYTYLRAEDNRRIIVPNERLAASTIENFTIVDPRIEVEVTIGLPLETAIRTVPSRRCPRWTTHMWRCRQWRKTGMSYSSAATPAARSTAAKSQRGFERRVWSA